VSPLLRLALLGLGCDHLQWQALKGNLFVAGLRKTLLARVALDGERVIEVESLFADLWLRIRGVAQSPDQRLYVISENGKIFRIERAAPGT
jgi:glucose/arabinose dehydrogenase